MITIQELLINRGLPKDARIQLVRQKTSTVNLVEMYREKREEFLLYQSSQSSRVFQKTDYIVAFLGEDGCRSRFIGVYKILGEEYPIADNHKWDTEDKYYYPMKEVSGFEDLKEKAIVKWTYRKPREWHKDFNNELGLVEMSPGLLYKQFPGYLDFCINFNELKEIITEEYSDWQKALSNVFGVYCICDTNTGKLYIGSAYEKDKSIWHRWSEYVKTNGCCDNKKLVELIKKHPNYAKHFNFSLLAIRSKHATSIEVINLEQKFKEKFDTQNHGYNDN